MQEKMKMILQKNENLVLVQQQYGVFFCEKIDSKSGFLDASSHLYKRVCPSVRPSVRPSIGLSVRPSVRRSVTPSLSRRKKVFRSTLCRVSGLVMNLILIKLKKNELNMKLKYFQKHSGLSLLFRKPASFLFFEYLSKF